MGLTDVFKKFQDVFFFLFISTLSFRWAGCVIAALLGSVRSVSPVTERALRTISVCQAQEALQKEAPDNAAMNRVPEDRRTTCTDATLSQKSFSRSADFVR